MAYFKHLENFIADFGYNLGVIFVAGPLAVYLIEKAARDHD